jgi:hypothetical protein
MMSKTMGLKFAPMLIVFYFVLTFCVFTMGALTLLLYKLFVFKTTNFIVFSMGFIIATYASVTQVFFLVSTLGNIGLAIYGLI